MTDRETEPKHPPRAGSGSDALPDGTEAPPPGVRTMAILRWALVALMATIAAGTWLSWARTPTQAHGAHASAQYRCPMHPSVLQDRPGSCPICGMDLALASARGAAPVSAANTAPVGLVPVTLGAERAQRIGVRTAVVSRQRVAPQLRTVGFISANEGALAMVTSRVTGWIEDLQVAQSGQRVAKGDALATIYSPELVTAQTSYLNTFRWSEKQAGGATPSAATAGLEADARRRLEVYGMARQDVAQIARSGQIFNAVPIRAPVDGYVARKSALAGLYVQPGTELFQIVDLSTVWVVADVYEHEMSRVRVGQTARLALGAHPGEIFTGRVQFIYPAVNPETRTLQARMEFRNPGLKLRPGMFGDVVIEGAATESLAVPTEAVVETGESQYVFIARAEGRFEPRRIRTGLRRDDRVEVLDGLEAGERVVTTANFLVDSESRLQAAVEQFRAQP